MTMMTRSTLPWWMVRETSTASSWATGLHHSILHYSLYASTHYSSIWKNVALLTLSLLLRQVHTFDLVAHLEFWLTWIFLSECCFDRFSFKLVAHLPPGFSYMAQLELTTMSHAGGRYWGNFEDSRSYFDDITWCFYDHMWYFYDLMWYFYDLTWYFYDLMWYFHHLMWYFDHFSLQWIF